MVDGCAPNLPLSSATTQGVHSPPDLVHILCSHLFEVPSSASRVFVMLNCWCCFQFIASDAFVAFQLQIVPKKLDMLDTLYRTRLELTRTIRGMLDWQKSDEKLQTSFFDFFDFFIFSITSNHTWARFSEMTVVKIVGQAAFLGKRKVLRCLGCQKLSCHSSLNTRLFRVNFDIFWIASTSPRGLYIV